MLFHLQCADLLFAEHHDCMEENQSTVIFFSANILASDKDLIQAHFNYTERVLKCFPTDDVQLFVQESGLRSAASFDTEEQAVRLEMKPLLSYCVMPVRLIKAEEQQMEPAVRLTGESFSDKNDARFCLS